jgi:hypothetical protein
VDIQKKLCFSDQCLNKFSTLTVDDRKSDWCEHLKEGQTATEMASQIVIKLESLNDLNLDLGILDQVKSQSYNGLITCYEVNSHTVVTPTFNSISVSGVIGLTHVKDLVCKLKDCKSLKTQHALAKRTEKICLHNLMVLKTGKVPESKVTKEVINKIDHVKTVDELLKKVDQHFPSMNEEALKEFLPINKDFVDTLR